MAVNPKGLCVLRCSVLSGCLWPHPLSMGCSHKTGTRKPAWAPPQWLSPIVRSSQTPIRIACFVLSCVSGSSHSILSWWALSTPWRWSWDLLISSAVCPSILCVSTGMYIHRCGYPSSCWDFRVGSDLGLLWTKLLWTFRYKIWGEHLCTLCYMCSGEELLGSVPSEDIVKRFSKEAVTKSTGSSSGITFPHSPTSGEGRLSFHEPRWWANSAVM